MPSILLFLTFVTNAILTLIAWRTIVLARRIQTEFALLQAAVVVMLCVAGVVASIQDIGFQLTQLGVLSEEVGKAFVGGVQAALVIGGLLILVPVLSVLRRLTAEFAQAEAVSLKLANRLPEGVTIESSGLTQRETEVVAAIGDGHVSDRELADQLFISPATAGTHVRNIMRKTGVRRREDLVLLTVEPVESLTETLTRRSVGS